MTDTPVFAHAAVAAPHPLAAEAGQRVLIQGGNALEAMVAMATTMAVVSPHCNGIGGDACWLVADRARRVHVIDASGPAGAKAAASAYRDEGYDAVPARGPLAALTVPGAVGGWMLALEMARAFGGRLPLDLLMGDAIRHARDGVPVAAAQGRVALRDFEALSQAPGFAPLFLKEGKPLPAGALMVQGALADTLEQLSHACLADFYRGDVGREIAADLDRLGSPVIRSDLGRYEARSQAPLSLAVAGGRLYGAPAQGLATLVTLGLIERLGIRRAESFEHIHGLIEAVKRAVALCGLAIDADRDPETLLAPALLEKEAGGISSGSAAPAPPIDLAGDAAWMGAVDQDGLAVSAIQSLFWDFGSGLVLPRTGMLMHNRGAAFSLDPVARNRLQPGRKLLRALDPALALFDDGGVMPFGAAGGAAQVPAQVFARLRLGMGLAEAIEAPRFVLGRPSGERETVLRLEDGFDDGLVRALERVGHPVAVTGASHADLFGQAGALLRHRRDGRIEATHDPRADGGAMGV